MIFTGYGRITESSILKRADFEGFYYYFGNRKTHTQQQQQHKNYNWFPTDGWHASGTFLMTPKHPEKKESHSSTVTRLHTTQNSKDKSCGFSSSSSISDRFIFLARIGKFLSVFSCFGYNILLGVVICPLGNLDFIRLSALCSGSGNNKRLDFFYSETNWLQCSGIGWKSTKGILYRGHNVANSTARDNSLSFSSRLAASLLYFCVPVAVVWLLL